MTTEIITWHVLAEHPEDLPDADTTVLISLDESHDEPSWMGFYAGETWHDITGMQITDVLAWADMPAGLRR
jgi:hypothetical protein